ncbi:MAG: peptide chain release factor N(5)-glutamine methyltransferase [Spirochaetales bacterium]|nr:peptide chain release factor N(5)-glutamine methyltransferase [Spirochaetales bacterium]
MKLVQLYRDAVRSFASVGDSPEADARTIICNYFNWDGTAFFLNMEKPVSDTDCSALSALFARRAAGEPVAYITGERGFYECVFKVSSDTLIPRADTEILVESAISDLKSFFSDRGKIRLLDLCCGTGCIGISVAKALARSFADVELVLADVSEKALAVCRENVSNLVDEKNISCSLVHGNLFENITGAFDAILTNPPYIRSSVIPTLEAQVRREPDIALDGGEDGLEFVRAIASQAGIFLEDCGFLFMEIGYDQGQDAAGIFRASGLRDVTVIRDLGGNDRVVRGRK